MDKEVLCYNCFEDISDNMSETCPHCGYNPKNDAGKFPLSLPHGTVLNGKYITGRVLGQGGFGVTYIAKDWKEGHVVAIKEYLPDTVATRVDGYTVSAFSGQRGESFGYGMECFLKEAQTLAEFIGNPNIVRVHSYFEENGTAYFVMDYIEGKSFETYIKEHGGKVGWQEAERFLLPVMEALDAVHTRGVVHRDVTPDNILVTEDGVVKLLDFGAARYSLGDRSRSLDVVLKHGFAPKEQYTRHGRQGAYTDVYTVAASFYYAITGRKPPDSIDRLEDDNLVPPSSLGIKIPPYIEDAILKGMEVQPADRYQSMAEFKEALSADMPQEDVRQENATQNQGNMPQSRNNMPRSQSNMPQNQNNVTQNQVESVQYNDEEKNGHTDSKIKDIPERKNIKWLFPAGIGGAVAVLALVIILINIAKPSSVPSANNMAKKSGGGTVGDMPNAVSKAVSDSSENAVVHNSICNISNGGIAVEDDTYKYYAAGNILRVDKKTGDAEVLADVGAGSMNLYEGSLYYIVSGAVYQSGTDGGEPYPMLDGDNTKYSSMYIDNNGKVYLYADGSLFTADIKDFKPKTVLSGIRTDDYTADGNYIYYRDARDGMFYRVRSDGSGKDKLSESYCFDPVINKNSVYVNDFDSIKKIVIKEPASTHFIETVYKNLLSGDIYGMNIIDDTIYFYVDGSDMKETICSVKTDGSGYKKIFEVQGKDDKIYNINLLQDEIVVYYYNAEEKKMAIMAIDTANGGQKIMY